MINSFCNNFMTINTEKTNNFLKSHAKDIYLFPMFTHENIFSNTKYNISEYKQFNCNP